LVRLSRARFLIWVAQFAAALALIAIPWPGLARGFSAGYAALVNQALFAHLAFGQGGHARLRPAEADELRGPQNVTPDSVIALQVDGYTGDLTFGMSLRRDAYLPIGILLATVLTAPLPWRRRLRGAAGGGAVMLLLTGACQWFGVLWLFASHLAAVMALGARSQALIDGLYQSLLLPPANRFLVPLFLGIALVWRQLGRSAAAVSGPADLPQPAPATT
jgi:hypothetical protein